MKPGVESRTKALNRKLFHHANEYERAKWKTIERDKHTSKYIGTRTCWRGNKKEDVLLWLWMIAWLEDVKEKGREEKKKRIIGNKKSMVLQPAMLD